MKRDYYEILGVSRNASQSEIKRAFYRLAQKYHPDRNAGDREAEERFKEIVEAYEVLSDEEKRALYDRYGHAGVQGTAGHHSGFYDFEEIFKRFFGGDPFEGFFRSQQRQRSRKKTRGGDIYIKVQLSLEEIYSGVHKRIKLRRYEHCPDCHGSGGTGRQTCPHCGGIGQVQQRIGGGFFTQIVVSTCPVCEGSGEIIIQKCKTCKGEGRIETDSVIEFDIPPGVTNGMQVRIEGKGHAGPRNGPYGNLYVDIEEIPHSHYHHEGKNLIYDLMLSYPQAVLGTVVEIPTLDGKKLRFEVPPGSYPGKIYRLKGKGLPDPHGGLPGDLLIHINIWVPSRITQEEKALLEKLQSAKNFVPKEQHGKSKSLLEKIKEFLHIS